MQNKQFFLLSLIMTNSLMASGGGYISKKLVNIFKTQNITNKEN